MMTDISLCSLTRYELREVWALIQETGEHHENLALWASDSAEKAFHEYRSAIYFGIAEKLLPVLTSADPLSRAS